MYKYVQHQGGDRAGQDGRHQGRHSVLRPRYVKFVEFENFEFDYSDFLIF
jgi:hypothetical protein